MDYLVQKELENNILFRKYIRENSYLYKTLIRYPDKVSEIKKKMNEDYHLRIQDKVCDTVKYINIMTNIIENML